MPLILSIDQSTAATKALLWTLDGSLAARSDIPHRQITNERGWVEHDPMEIYRNTLESVRLVIGKAGIPAERIHAIGLTNQRETAVCWDFKTGLPLHNAVVWQCSRARGLIGESRIKTLEDEIRKRTGLQLSPYFSAAKWLWMVKNSQEIRSAKEQGVLCCGTMDSWLLFKLAGVFKTDLSNASRTQLLNLHTHKWDKEIAEAFEINTDHLPEIHMSDHYFGQTNLGGILPNPVPIRSVMGDSHAALFGNQCWELMTAKATYGTGSSVMMNAGNTCPIPKAGIVSSIAWGIDGKIDYVLEGNINDTGSVIKWLAEDIGLLDEPKNAGKIAAAVNDTGGVYLIPAFSGLGAPYFNNNARAAFLGMNRNTKKAQLIRAAEECIAYQIKDVAEAIRVSCGIPLSVLRVDGGPARDEFLMQFQSDMLGIELEINQTEELSGMGAAYCAAAAMGLTDLKNIFAGQKRRIIKPKMDDERRDSLYRGWKEAIKIINGG